MGIEPPAQVESTQVKNELKEKIKTKYNGTELPQVEMKEPEPPKPVSKVQIYAEEMLICAFDISVYMYKLCGQGNVRRQSEALVPASSVNRNMQVNTMRTFSFESSIKKHLRFRSLSSYIAKKCNMFIMTHFLLLI